MCSENGRRPEPEAVPAFKEYSLEQLKAATNGFSSEYIVSESGEKAPNFVYKGRLDQSRWIAVKRFPKAAWPDSKGFAVNVFTCPQTILCLMRTEEGRLRFCVRGAYVPRGFDSCPYTYYVSEVSVT